MAVLYGNDVLSILVLSTKKRPFRFLIKFFVFQKICFKVKVLKTFKISTDCHIKVPISQTEGYFENPLVPFFRGTYALSAGFKMKSQKAFSSVKTKTNPNFAVKLAE